MRDDTNSIRSRPLRRLRIVYGAERHGSLLPWNGTPPLVSGLEPVSIGGMARFVAALNDEGEGGETPRIVLSGGGEIAGGPFDPNESTPTMNALRSGLVVRGLSTAGTAAMCLGDEELGLGPAGLERLFASAGFPLLCANLHLPRPIPARPPFVPAVTLDAGGLEVFVVGLVCRDLEVNEFGLGLPEGFTVADPVSVGLRLAKSREALQADLLLFLCHTGERTCRELARALHRPALLLFAHGREPEELLYRIGGCWIGGFEYRVPSVSTFEVTLDGKVGIAAVRLHRTRLDDHYPSDRNLEAAAVAATVLARRTCLVDRYALEDCPFCSDTDDALALLARRLGSSVLIRRFTLPPRGANPALRKLAADGWRADRLSVTRSPEIFVENTRYHGPMTGPEAVDALEAVAMAFLHGLDLPRRIRTVFTRRAGYRSAPGSSTTTASSDNACFHRPAAVHATASLQVCPGMWRTGIRRAERILDRLLPGVTVVQADTTDGTGATAPGTSRCRAFPRLFVPEGIESFPGFQEHIADFLDPCLQGGYFVSRRIFPPFCFPPGNGTWTLVTDSSRVAGPLPAETLTAGHAPRTAAEPVDLASPGGRRWLKEFTHGLFQADELPLPLPWLVTPWGEILCPSDPDELAWLLSRTGLCAEDNR